MHSVHFTVMILRKNYVFSRHLKVLISVQIDKGLQAVNFKSVGP